MNRIKIIEILLINLSLLCYLGSHLILSYFYFMREVKFFGSIYSLNLVVDILLAISIAVPLIVVILILKD